eukprot:8088648-Pyramimonas_sp.AAC.1
MTVKNDLGQLGKAGAHPTPRSPPGARGYLCIRPGPASRESHPALLGARARCAKLGDLMRPQLSWPAPPARTAARAARRPLQGRGMGRIRRGASESGGGRTIQVDLTCYLHLSRPPDSFDRPSESPDPSSRRRGVVEEEGGQELRDRNPRSSSPYLFTSLLPPSPSPILLILALLLAPSGSAWPQRLGGVAAAARPSRAAEGASQDSCGQRGESEA